MQAHQQAAVAALTFVTVQQTEYLLRCCTNWPPVDSRDGAPSDVFPKHDLWDDSPVHGGVQPVPAANREGGVENDAVNAIELTQEIAG